MTLSILRAGLILLPLAACNKGDKVAAYAEIPAVELVTNTAQGSNTTKITDAWVSLDDHFVGVWELPARIPLLAEGAHKVTVTPAIKRNGTFDDRLRYPFYTSWDGVAELVREGTTLLLPQTGYIPEAELWIEAFEDVFARLNVSDDSDTTLIRYVPAENPDLLFLDDSPCGGFTLEGTRDHMRLYTDEDFEVNGGPVFLELDYRSNVVLAVGALFSVGGTLGSSELVYVTPTVKSDGTMPWNKIYIDLSTVFNAPVSDRDVYIDALLPIGQSSAEVYIDNFKLVKLAP